MTQAPLMARRRPEIALAALVLAARRRRTPLLPDLAAILPDPEGRSASQPSRFVRNRAASILDGAATIRADGRADCF